MQRPINAMPAMLVSWLGLGAATGFFTWIVRTAPDGPGPPETALAGYAGSLLIGLVASAPLFALTWVLRISQWFARISYASCLLYLSVLATPDGLMLAWAFPVVACSLLGLLRHSRIAEARVALVLVHAMGTLSGLYLSFQLPSFIASWPAFREVLAALWLLLV